MSGKSGTVALFLSNLPPNVSPKDLRIFVKQGLRQGGVGRIPVFNLCSNCRILRITDLASGVSEYHGFVEVKPAHVAIRAIQVLQGQEIRGVTIQVRRYRHRSAWGEHRYRADDFHGSALVAEPLIERRRANVRIELVDATPRTDEYQGEPALSI